MLLLLVVVLLCVHPSCPYPPHHLLLLLFGTHSRARLWFRHAGLCCLQSNCDFSNNANQTTLNLQMIQDDGREADVPPMALEALSQLKMRHPDDIIFTPAFVPAMQMVLVSSLGGLFSSWLIQLMQGVNQ